MQNEAEAVEASRNVAFLEHPSCAVCGDDKEVLKNYQVYTCYGCKSFFRRSIKEHRIYTCLKDRNCSISKLSRNACRFCRLQKCFAVGMNEAYIRDGRNNRQRMAEKEPSPPFSPARPCVHGPGTSALSADSRNLIDFFISMTDVCLNTYDPRYERLEAEEWESLERHFNRSCTVTEGLHDPSKVGPRWKFDFTCTRPAQTHDIVLGWHRVFIYLADWVNAIPQFRLLPASDREFLFRSNFVKLSFLFYGYYTRFKTRIVDGKVPLGNGTYNLRHDSDTSFSNMETVATDYFELFIVKPFEEMEIDEGEHLLYKALCLFECRDALTETGKVMANNFVDQLTDALFEYQEKRFLHLTSMERNRRYTRFLMTMCKLMEIWNASKDRHFALATFGYMNLDGIVSELLYESTNHHALSRI